MSLQDSSNLTDCKDCGLPYNSSVNLGCPRCDRDTWHKQSDGLRLAWEHADTGALVAIVPKSPYEVEDMRDSIHSTSRKQYQLLVRDQPRGDILWPAEYPRHGGRGLYQTLQAARGAAESAREHISGGKAPSALGGDLA